MERGFHSCIGDGANRGEAEDAEKVKRFNTERTEETRRTQRKKEGFADWVRAEAMAETSSKTPA
jgi:hypothetical protein